MRPRLSQSGRVVLPRPSRRGHVGMRMRGAALGRGPGRAGDGAGSPSAVRRRGQPHASLSLRCLSLTLLAGVGVADFPSASHAQEVVPPIRVIAPAPGGGGGARRPARRPTVAPTAPSAPAVTPAVTTIADPTVIDRDKVPSSTQTLTADDFQRTYSPSVTNVLMER